jgi:hypothetical protein
VAREQDGGALRQHARKEYARSINRRVAAAEMYLSTSLRSKEPASAVSMRGRSSNTRKSRTGAKLRLRTPQASALISFWFPPADHRGFDTSACFRVSPGALGPLA